MPMAKNLTSVFRPLQIHLLLVLLVLRPFLLEAANPLRHFCGSTGNFTVNSTYDENLSSLLSSISSDNSVTYGFYSLSYGQSPNRVNGIAVCRGDVALSDCQTCIKNSSLEIIRRCPVQKEAIMYYDNCLLRYSDQSILGVVDTNNYYYMRNGDNSTNVTEFNRVLMEQMDGLRSGAAAGRSSRKLAVGNTNAPGSQTLYGLAQVAPASPLPASLLAVSSSATAVVRAVSLCPSLAYPPAASPLPPQQAFLPPASPPAGSPPRASPPVSPPNPEGKTSSTAHPIIIVVVSIVAVCLLVVGIFCIRRRRGTKPIKNDETADGIITAESLQYDFETVRAATDNFSNENKLGQGGFGSVYKGMLANGQEIAVKRLSRGEGQGHKEFKTEVLLVARFQHRNLVRLLGFSLSGDERLLIYEFMPNSSLDRFIFDPVKRRQLDWERHRKIIGGIVRGLVYLHEDSQLRVIHRDLKASNVLLDAEMNPKISDFGMARLFAMDETHAATSRIVGTYGYMAPEYGLYGHFSVKSDVYSFGVLVLEIVSGQRNSPPPPNGDSDSAQDLLSIAWRNWREGTMSNIIDPLLINNESRTEIQRCIHIGLLCVQGNASSRPNMASVLLMMNSFSMPLPVPSQPAFYMHSSAESSMAVNDLNQGSTNEVTVTDMCPQ